MKPECNALLTKVLCYRGLEVLSLAWIPSKITLHRQTVTNADIQQIQTNADRGNRQIQQNQMKCLLTLVGISQCSVNWP